MSKSVAERVLGLISHEQGIKISALRRDATFKSLGMDSLDMVETVMALEEEFHGEIPDDDAEKMKTIGDVITYIEVKVAAHKQDVAPRRPWS